MVNGKFQTPLLASGEIYRIKVRIDGGDQPVELTSVADPAKTDVVRVKVKFECGCLRLPSRAGAGTGGRRQASRARCSVGVWR